MSRRPIALLAAAAVAIAVLLLPALVWSLRGSLALRAVPAIAAATGARVTLVPEPGQPGEARLRLRRVEVALPQAGAQLTAAHAALALTPGAARPVEVAVAHLAVAVDLDAASDPAPSSRGTPSPIGPAVPSAIALALPSGEVAVLGRGLAAPVVLRWRGVVDDDGFRGGLTLVETARPDATPLASGKVMIARVADRLAVRAGLAQVRPVDLPGLGASDLRIDIDAEIGRTAAAQRVDLGVAWTRLAARDLVQGPGEARVVVAPGIAAGSVVIADTDGSLALAVAGGSVGSGALGCVYSLGLAAPGPADFGAPRLPVLDWVVGAPHHGVAGTVAAEAAGPCPGTTTSPTDLLAGLSSVRLSVDLLAQAPALGSRVRAAVELGGEAAGTGWSGKGAAAIQHDPIAGVPDAPLADVPRLRLSAGGDRARLGLDRTPDGVRASLDPVSMIAWIDPKIPSRLVGALTLDVDADGRITAAGLPRMRISHTALGPEVAASGTVAWRRAGGPRDALTAAVDVTVARHTERRAGPPRHLRWPITITAGRDGGHVTTRDDGEGLLDFGADRGAYAIRLPKRGNHRPVFSIDLADPDRPAVSADLRIEARAREDERGAGWLGDLALDVATSTEPEAPDRHRLTATLDVGSGLVSTATGHYDHRAGRLELALALPERKLGAADGIDLARVSPALAAALTRPTARLKGGGSLVWNRDRPDQLDGRIGLDLTDASFGWQSLRVDALAVRLDIDPLWPPATPHPVQLRARLIEAGTPLEDVELTGRLDGTEAIRIESGTARAGGGRLTLQPGRIGFDGRGAIVVEVEQVALAPLIARAEVDGLSIDGSVSGSVPLGFAPDGVTISGARLAADEPGKLRYAPAAPPAALTNGPAAMLLEVFRDFDYGSITATGRRSPGAAAGLTLQLKGRNRDFQGGRPVEFNLDLSGDLFELVTRGLAAWRLPETLREQLQRR